MITTKQIGPLAHAADALKLIQADSWVGKLRTAGLQDQAADLERALGELRRLACQFDAQARAAFCAARQGEIE